MALKYTIQSADHGKLLLFGTVTVSVIIAQTLGLNPVKLIQVLQTHHKEAVSVFQSDPLPTLFIFFILHISALTLSLPGAVLPFCIVAGAIFGPVWGSAIIVASLTVGDSLGFLVARHLLRDWFRERFSRRLTSIEREIASSGALYLFALRLTAAVPFFVINVGMALTPMRLKTFAPVSLLGLIPSSILYVNAGTQVATISTPADALSPQLIVSLILLGVFPLLVRILLGRTSISDPTFPAPGSQNEPPR